jgi:hypothetical protein
MAIQLEHCFRHSGLPCSDPNVHAAFVEVEVWRMLEDARRADPELNSVRALEEWTVRQQGDLSRVRDSDERDYRLCVLKIATNRVRSRLPDGLSGATGSAALRMAEPGESTAGNQFQAPPHDARRGGGAQWLTAEAPCR